VHETAVTGLGVALSVERYLIGIAAVALVVGVLAWGAYRVRRALLPDWSGPPARLAETVIALGTQFVALYGLGSVGGFHGPPVLIVGSCSSLRARLRSLPRNGPVTSGTWPAMA
jgi:hypothetical protein